MRYLSVRFSAGNQQKDVVFAHVLNMATMPFFVLISCKTRPRESAQGNENGSSVCKECNIVLHVTFMFGRFWSFGCLFFFGQAVGLCAGVFM